MQPPEEAIVSVLILYQLVPLIAQNDLEEVKIQIKEVMLEISDQFPIKQVYFFGGHKRDEKNYHKDLDVVIIASDSSYLTKLRIARKFLERYVNIAKKERDDPITIDLFIHNSREYNKLKEVDFFKDIDLESIF